MWYSEGEVPVAQWIEHRSPEPGAQVQFLSGTPHEARPRLASFFHVLLLISSDSNRDSNGIFLGGQ